MLLAIDVGNTNIVLGVFDGERLAESWRLATLRERTADEVGILVTHLFERSGIALDRVSGIILSSVVPPLTRPMEEMASATSAAKPLTVDPAATPACRCCTRRRPTSAPTASSTPWRRTRPTDAPRQSPVIVVDFGTGDDVRRDFGGRRVHRRRDLSRHRHLRRRAVPAGRTAAPRRGAKAAGGHRPDDGHVDAVGPVLRVRVDGRRHRGADARRSSRAATAPPASRPAAWPTSSPAKPSPSSASIRI